MANTERLAVLKKVRVAKQEANSLRADDTIPAKDRELIEQAYTSLDEVEDDLILQEIGDRINELNVASAELSKITAQMDADIKNIQKVINLVGDAAKALKALADIATTVATAGIL